MCWVLLRWGAHVFLISCSACTRACSLLSRMFTTLDYLAEANHTQCCACRWSCRRARTYAALHHLHVYLDNHHLRPDCVLDLESIWMGLPNGWVGFCWRNSRSYRIRMCCPRLFVHAWKAKWSRHPGAQLPSPQCHAYRYRYRISLGGMVRLQCWFGTICQPPRCYGCCMHQSRSLCWWYHLVLG